MRLPKWALRPDIISYVVDAYAGTDETPGSKTKRRVFIWEDGAEIKMGNCEAFADHLGKKFELLRAVNSSDIHTMLREMGEVVQQHKQHSPRVNTDSGYMRPDPDEWVIGVVTPTDEGPA